MFGQVTVLGVGLLGASLALAMKRSGICPQVVGYGRTMDNLIRAKGKGIIDSYELDPARACEGSDLVVFATPVGAFASLAAKLRGSLAEGAIVIDVGSVKGGIVHELEKLTGAGGRFVGCHPIAGSERSGMDAASAELFRDALCIITVTDRTDRASLEKISALWGALECRVETMSPEEHDRIYAIVSHVPHLIAYALVNAVADTDPVYVKYAGKGFKDMTRIASSPPELWRDICMMNMDNILKFTERFRENMERLLISLRDGDADGLKEAFKRARALRKSIDNKT